MKALRTVSRLLLLCVAQLFIMLGNDRANEFWAAGLSPAQQLDSDASPEQRKDFIVQKYREGRYRLRSPAFSNQEELLKVRRSVQLLKETPSLHTWGTWVTLVLDGGALV